MCYAAINRVGSRAQGLGQDLAAEYALRADIPANAPEHIDLEGLEFHQLDQFLECFGLPAHFPTGVPTAP